MSHRATRLSPTMDRSIFCAQVWSEDVGCHATLGAWATRWQIDCGLVKLGSRRTCRWSKMSDTHLLTHWKCWVRSSEGQKSSLSKVRVSVGWHCCMLCPIFSPGSNMLWPPMSTIESYKFIVCIGEAQPTPYTISYNFAETNHTLSPLLLQVSNASLDHGTFEITHTQLIIATVHSHRL